MKLVAKILGLAVGLAALAGIVWCAWLGIGFVASLFAELDPQVAKVTGIASVVVLLASKIVASAIREAAKKTRA
jgi:Mg/Co/Ni transporter MgtE